MILIGSRAAKSFVKNSREPNKDWDIIGSKEEIYNFLNRHKDKIVYSYPSSPTKIQTKFSDGTKMEFELDIIPSNKIILEDMKKNWDIKVTYRLYDEVLDVCQPIFLMLMKRALAPWPVHWEKTILDYHDIRKYLNPLDYSIDRGRIERQHPNFLSESEKKFYALRLQENEKKFGEKKISLDMSEKKFFGRSQKVRIIEHDKLHELVMFYEEPLFKELKISEDKPLLSEEKFRNSFSFDDRIKLAQEECLAIAFERFIIRDIWSDQVSLQDSYNKAVKLVVTRLTKGWYCDFIIDHYDHVLEIPESHLFKAKENLLNYLQESCLA